MTHSNPACTGAGGLLPELKKEYPKTHINFVPCHTKHFISVARGFNEKKLEGEYEGSVGKDY